MEDFKSPSTYVYPNDMCELIKTLTNIIENKKKIDIDKKKIWEIINNMYDQWIRITEAEKENDKKDYYKLIAFLTLLLSTNWFNEEHEELECIINEIYYTSVGLSQSFTEEEVSKAIEKSLGAKIKKCIIDKHCLTVEFINGDYGEGVFDGKIVLDLYCGLLLHKDKEILQYMGELPTCSYDLELAMNSCEWKIYETKKK